MTQITVNFNDKNNVRQGLTNVGEAIPGVLKADVKEAMEWAKWYASGGYPSGGYNGYNVAPPPNSGYQRTGIYGRSFRVVDNGYRSYTLTSNAVQDGRSYTPFVGGYADGSGQAGIHVGRWPKIKDAVTMAAGQLLKQAEESLRTLFSKEGIGL